MAIKLTVPFVTQRNIGGHAIKQSFMSRITGNKKRGWDDWTGCWYASACMIGYFFSAGPRMGVPELFVNSQGHVATGSDAAYALEQKHHDLLAKREGLKAVAGCSAAKNFTVGELEALLSTNGPIFMYWTKAHGASSYGHASVIVGVTDTSVIYHDPESGPDQIMSIGTFNHVKQNWQYALMQKDFATNPSVGGGAKAY